MKDFKECKICGTKYKSMECNHELVLASNIPQANNKDLDTDYWRNLALRLQNIGIDLAEKLGKNGVEVMRIR